MHSRPSLLQRAPDREFESTHARVSPRERTRAPVRAHQSERASPRAHTCAPVRESTRAHQSARARPRVRTRAPVREHSLHTVWGGAQPQQRERSQQRSNSHVSSAASGSQGTVKQANIWKAYQAHTTGPLSCMAARACTRAEQPSAQNILSTPLRPLGPLTP
jgi:hypothetical protein